MRRVLRPFSRPPAARRPSGRARGGCLSPDPDPTPPASGRRRSSLDARAGAATLELYALETELSRARAAAEAIAARRAAAGREHAAIRTQLRVARQAQDVSAARLARLLRTLYEQSGARDPIAIVLGAASLEEALTGLDNLDRAAGDSQRIVEQPRSARARLGKLDARLTAREAELARLASVAEARADELAAAAVQRRDFVAGLRRQEGFSTARIASIEAHAAAADLRTRELESQPPAPTSATAAPAGAPAPAAAAVAPANDPGTITVTATGYSIRGRTASGLPTAPGVVAVDPSLIPLGTRLTIPGYGEGVAADTGGAVQGNVIDVWFPTNAQALAWGRRTLTITLHCAVHSAAAWTRPQRPR